MKNFDWKSFFVELCLALGFVIVMVFIIVGTVGLIKLTIVYNCVWLSFIVMILQAFAVTFIVRGKRDIKKNINKTVKKEKYYMPNDEFDYGHNVNHKPIDLEW